jgi:hypothetical protein
MERPKLDMNKVPSVKYEIFREFLNDEIAYHIEQLRQLGEETPQGQGHLEVMKNLAELRNSIGANDDNVMDAVFIALKAARVSRNDNMPELTRK